MTRVNRSSGNWAAALTSTKSPVWAPEPPPVPLAHPPRERAVRVSDEAVDGGQRQARLGGAAAEGADDDRPGAAVGEEQPDGVAHRMGRVHDVAEGPDVVGEAGQGDGRVARALARRTDEGGHRRRHPGDDVGTRLLLDDVDAGIGGLYGHESLPGCVRHGRAAKRQSPGRRVVGLFVARLQRISAPSTRRRRNVAAPSGASGVEGAAARAERHHVPALGEHRLQPGTGPQPHLCPQQVAEVGVVPQRL